MFKLCFFYGWLVSVMVGLPRWLVIVNKIYNFEAYIFVCPVVYMLFGGLFLCVFCEYLPWVVLSIWLQDTSLAFHTLQIHFKMVFYDKQKWKSWTLLLIMLMVWVHQGLNDLKFFFIYKAKFKKMASSFYKKPIQSQKAPGNSGRILAKIMIYFLVMALPIHVVWQLVFVVILIIMLRKRFQIQMDAIYWWK